MEKKLEEDFRKTIQLRNDIMDQMADMMTNGLVIEHKVETVEEKEVEKKAEERLEQLLGEIRKTNLGVNYLDTDQSLLKGIEAQVNKRFEWVNV